MGFRCVAVCKSGTVRAGWGRWLIPEGGNVKVQGLTPAVPCLFPGCIETVRFDLGSAN